MTLTQALQAQIDKPGVINANGFPSIYFDKEVGIVAHRCQRPRARYNTPCAFVLVRKQLKRLVRKGYVYPGISRFIGPKQLSA